MKIALAASLLLILAAFVLSAYFYPQMPDKIASHWNAGGVADGYMDKSVVIFLVPVISVLLSLLFLALPRIDPMKKNIKKFSAYYEGFVVTLLAFMLYVHALVIAWNIGIVFSMSQMLAPAIGIFFYYIGVMTSHSKRNYSIGIRTPWTLSNEKVWEKTHAVGGKLFKIAGVIAIAGTLFPEYAFYIVLAPIIAASAAVYVYSYAIYRKETAAGK